MRRWTNARQTGYKKTFAKDGEPIMKVLITGGLGVNGAVTGRLLVKDGLRPVLLDNRMDLTLAGDIKDQVDIVIGDICDRSALEKAVDDHGVTHIAHLAALMPEPAEADPRLAVQVSAGGTVNVLEVARAKNVKRVVFTSSKAAYGEITGEYAPPECRPVREDYRREPADLYGSLKVCCEELGRYYRETYGIEFIALRFVSSGSGGLVCGVSTIIRSSGSCPFSTTMFAP